MLVSEHSGPKSCIPKPNCGHGSVSKSCVWGCTIHKNCLWGCRTRGLHAKTACGAELYAKIACKRKLESKILHSRNAGRGRGDYKQKLLVGRRYTQKLLVSEDLKPKSCVPKLDWGRGSVSKTCLWGCTIRKNCLWGWGRRVCKQKLLEGWHYTQKLLVSESLKLKSYTQEMPVEDEWTISKNCL